MTDTHVPHVCTYADLTAIANHWIEVGWQKGDVSALDTLHSQDFIDHDPTGRASDLASFKQGLTDLYTAFPDFYAEVSNLVMDETRQQVAIRWTAHGIHRGKFMGIPSTGKRIQFKGIEIIRIENGRICERWGEWDGIDILNQLGKEL